VDAMEIDAAVETGHVDMLRLLLSKGRFSVSGPKYPIYGNALSFAWLNGDAASQSLLRAAGAKLVWSESVFERLENDLGRLAQFADAAEPMMDERVGSYDGLLWGWRDVSESFRQMLRDGLVTRKAAAVIIVLFPRVLRDDAMLAELKQLGLTPDDFARSGGLFTIVRLSSEDFRQVVALVGRDWGQISVDLFDRLEQMVPGALETNAFEWAIEVLRRLIEVNAPGALKMVRCGGGSRFYRIIRMIEKCKSERRIKLWLAEVDKLNLDWTKHCISDRLSAFPRGCRGRRLADEFLRRGARGETGFDL
jgi:hypothetical protein